MGHILDSVKRSGLSTDEVGTLIDKWVFSARNRRILKLKLLHGLTYAELMEKTALSEDELKRIVKREVAALKLHF